MTIESFMFVFSLFFCLIGILVVQGIHLKYQRKRINRIFKSISKMRNEKEEIKEKYLKLIRDTRWSIHPAQLYLIKYRQGQLKKLVDEWYAGAIDEEIFSEHACVIFSDDLNDHPELINIWEKS